MATGWYGVSRKAKKRNAGTLFYCIKCHPHSGNPYTLPVMQSNGKKKSYKVWLTTPQIKLIIGCCWSKTKVNTMRCGSWNVNSSLIQMTESQITNLRTFIWLFFTFEWRHLWTLTMHCNHHASETAWTRSDQMDSDVSPSGMSGCLALHFKRKVSECPHSDRKHCLWLLLLYSSLRRQMMWKESYGSNTQKQKVCIWIH